MVLQYKAFTNKQPVDVSGFHCGDDAVLRDLETEQIRHMLRTSIAARIWASKGSCIRELVTFLFRDWTVSLTLMNRICFFQLILDSDWWQTETAFVKIRTPTIFEVTLLFHCSSLFNAGSQKKTLPLSQDYFMATLIDVYVRRLPTAAHRELFSEYIFVLVLVQEKASDSVE